MRMQDLIALHCSFIWQELFCFIALWLLIMTCKFSVVYFEKVLIKQQNHTTFCHEIFSTKIVHFGSKFIYCSFVKHYIHLFIVSNVTFFFFFFFWCVMFHSGVFLLGKIIPLSCLGYCKQNQIEHLCRGNHKGVDRKTSIQNKISIEIFSSSSQCHKCLWICI